MSGLRSRVPGTRTTFEEDNVSRSDENGNCRQCGKPFQRGEGGEDECVNPECPTNKKTRPICQNCRLIMEEAGDIPGGNNFRCPKCGVVSGP